MKRIVLAASACALLTACIAVDNSSYGPKPSSSTLTASDLVTARQAHMRMSVLTLGAVSRVGADETADPSQASFAAGGLAKFGRILPIYFGWETRMEAGTRALPQVWSDREGFAAAAADFAEVTRQLSAAADANDRAAFTDALASTKAACKACHDVYRTAD